MFSISAWLLATSELISSSAAWLLFGFFLAGIIHVILPQNLVKRYLKKPGLKSVFKASAIGVPLPLCSCSVIPVAVSLRRSGASRGAMASFLVSTPEIGIESFFLSYVLLGPLLAIARVIAAFASALSVGLAIDKWVVDVHTQKNEKKQMPNCCNNNQTTCANNNDNDKTLLRKAIDALHYGYVTLIDDLSKLLTIGFLTAGFITAVVPLEWFDNLQLGTLSSMLIMLAISLPVYVCATASTPIAAALLTKGLNPGAVLVFLLAGPATNVSTMLIVKKELGTKGLAIYLTGIISLAMALGALVNRIFNTHTTFTLPTTPEGMNLHHHPIAQVSGFLLILLLSASLARKIIQSSKS